MILEYLKVILSAPPIIAAAALVAILMFRRELAGLVSRIARIRLPGGGELFASQLDKTGERLSQAALPPAGAGQPPPQLPAGVSLPPDQLQSLQHLIQSERTNAATWEYRFLNLFLVRGTQVVLDWLASLRDPIGLRLLDSQLQPWIHDARERTAILSALESHRLVEVVNELVSVTPKGREYIQWRGPLPPATGAA